MTGNDRTTKTSKVTENSWEIDSHVVGDGDNYSSSNNVTSTDM